MKIYTAYFAQLNKIPLNIIPIAICGKSPDWYKGLEYKALAPKWSFFSKWKKDKDNNAYTKAYQAEVLGKLSLDLVLSELEELSNGQDIALICYEKTDDFCHRHQAGAWLSPNTRELCFGCANVCGEHKRCSAGTMKDIAVRNSL